MPARSAGWPPPYKAPSGGMTEPDEASALRLVSRKRADNTKMLLASSLDPAFALPSVTIPRTRLATDFAGTNRLLAGHVNESLHFIGAGAHSVETQPAHLLFDLTNSKAENSLFRPSSPQNFLSGGMFSAMFPKTAPAPEIPL
jgi:hypothetical protein